MDSLIAAVRGHKYSSAAPFTDALLAKIEEAHKCNLPNDFKKFYRSIGMAELFEGRYKILPLHEISSVGPLQGGEYGRLCCSPSWLAFCDALDSNYVAIDASSSRILDCDHEDMGRVRIIAASFSEFLHGLLFKGPDPYWLQPGFVAVGELTFEPTAEFYRLTDKDFWDRLGPEQGPEPCRSPGCNRKRIELSVMCRRHHYEMMRGRECPFGVN
ncbi:MAG TPA: SMI1/KNR4 family protein [Acidiferrobacterales bacterium]|nr:SMI1/KNR4 family protein [Acidiferrobacterales bacterium]